MTANERSVEIGQVVWLRSGGPSMTITYLPSANDKRYGVVWMDKDGHLQSAAVMIDWLL